MDTEIMSDPVYIVQSHRYQLLETFGERSLSSTFHFKCHVPLYKVVKGRVKPLNSTSYTKHFINKGGINFISL